MIALVPNPVPLAPTCIAVRVFEPETHLERALANSAKEIAAISPVALEPVPLWRVVLCLDGNAWLTAMVRDTPPGIDAAQECFRGYRPQWVQIVRANAAPDPAP